MERPGSARLVEHELPPITRPVLGSTAGSPSTKDMQQDAMLFGEWVTNADMPLYRGVRRCVRGALPSFFMNSEQLATYLLSRQQQHPVV